MNRKKRIKWKRLNHVEVIKNKTKINTPNILVITKKKTIINEENEEDAPKFVTKRSMSIIDEERLKKDSEALKIEMMNKEIEEAKQLNDEEMEKEIKNTKEMQMNEIESK